MDNLRLCAVTIKTSNECQWGTHFLSLEYFWVSFEHTSTQRNYESNSSYLLFKILFTICIYYNVFFHFIHLFIYLLFYYFFLSLYQKVCSCFRFKFHLTPTSKLSHSPSSTMWYQCTSSWRSWPALCGPQRRGLVGPRHACLHILFPM